MLAGLARSAPPQMDALGNSLGLALAACALGAAVCLLDGLDGALARRRGLTDAGGFLDIALDFLFYALVPFGFILA
ncbi:CDP-alcohol phosphatidyltransferase family protein, partial [Klebsiella pneumoniae]|uniref:CDP-alcohol phosphatidyltransferase family protein n=1 Tax=Klebsiella pneumoniae TaxID=573 RepID=UPI003F4E8851